MRFTTKKNYKESLNKMKSYFAEFSGVNLSWLSVALYFYNITFELMIVESSGDSFFEFF